MATNDSTAGESLGGSREAFRAKLAEIRDRAGEEPETFADRLESQGVDVEVREKDPEPVVADDPDSGPAPESAVAASEAVQADESGQKADDRSAPDPEAAQEAQDALLDAIEGQKPGDRRQSKIEEKRALEARLLELGEDPEIANLIAHRGKLSAAKKRIAQLESASDNSGAGLDEQASQGIPAASATPAGAPAPEVLERFQEAGLDEVPATAMAQELAALRAELAQVRQEARFSADAARAQHRQAAQGALDAAVGELAGEFPGLVRDGVTDPAVLKTAGALLQTPLIGGDLSKALRQAAAMRFPEVQGASRQTKQPTQTRDTNAPAPRQQSPSPPKKPVDQFKLIARTLGDNRNDVPKALAEANRLKKRMQG